MAATANAGASTPSCRRLRLLTTACGCEPQQQVASSSASTAAAAGAQPEAAGMAELDGRQKFLLDLHGFLVLPSVLSQAEVTALNGAVDASWDAQYTSWEDGLTHPCRRAAHQSNSFHEMVGMLEWQQPHCEPFRDLLSHTGIVAAMNTVHGRGWRLDHSPFLICGDGTNPEALKTGGHAVQRAAVAAATGALAERERQQLEQGNIGGMIHGHIWDPEYRYRYSNGQMRSGHMIAAFQLRDIEAGWGGFGIIPASHKCNYPLPPSLTVSSVTRIQPPMVDVPCNAGDVVLFFESALHASLPWFGPPGTERRSILYRMAPATSIHRVGWGGTTAFTYSQPRWVQQLTDDAQREALSPPRGTLNSAFPQVREGWEIAGGALRRKLKDD